MEAKKIGLWLLLAGDKEAFLVVGVFKWDFSNCGDTCITALMQMQERCVCVVLPEQVSTRHQQFFLRVDDGYILICRPAGWTYSFEIHADVSGNSSGSPPLKAGSPR